MMKYLFMPVVIKKVEKRWKEVKWITSVLAERKID